jgi:hypothetical protein
VLGNKTLGASREFRESGEILSLLKMGSTLDRYFNNGLNFSLNLGFNLGLRGTKFFFFHNHSFDTIVHVLNEILLRPTKSTFVGDVVNVVVSFGVLTVGTSDLDVEFISDLLEYSLALTKVGQVDVDRSTESGSTICGA